MAVRTGGTAPYAPPQAVLDLIRAYRTRGFQTPFTKDVLAKAGVKESVIIRTLQALKILELVEDDGHPTPAFDVLRRAAEAEFPDRLAEVVKIAYADVLQYLDLDTDSDERIADAFRAYEPLGQLSRMVTLFLGLCRAANMLPEDAPALRRASPAATKRGAASRPRRRAGTGAKDAACVAINVDMPPLIEGLIRELLSAREVGGWTRDKRDSYLNTFSMALDYTVSVVADDPNDPNDE